MDFLKPNFTPADPVRPAINIGAGFDIPTGSYMKGYRGEWVLSGGLAPITGLGGIGNHFKSTLLHHMTLSAADKIFSTTKTSISSLDNEMSKQEGRLAAFTRRFDYLKDEGLIDNGWWIITDKTKYHGNEWFEVLKKFLASKKENAKAATCTTPFLSRDKINPMKILIPTFSEIDSFTEFSTSEVERIYDENELGESGGNAANMRAALAKHRFLMEIPALVGSGYHYLLMTAQEVKSINIQTGPVNLPPPKKLQHMKAGVKMSGVTEKFYTVPNNSWQTNGAALMIDSKTKLPIYPKDDQDKEDADTDLNLISVTQLRGKNGPSGFSLDIVMSQSEGILPSLTEFHYIKESERFGLDGNLQHYCLDLYPDVKLSRTTVRSKIDSDPKLRRALNITSELCQMRHFYRHLRHELPTAKELFDGVKAKGWDWDMILGETRGWWTINDDNHPLKFLSTMDLIKIMSKEGYTPWWAEKR